MSGCGLSHESTEDGCMQLGEVLSVKTQGNGEYCKFNGLISLKQPLVNLIQWVRG